MMFRRTRSPEPIEEFFVAHFGSIHRADVLNVEADIVDIVESIRFDRRR